MVRFKWRGGTDSGRKTIIISYALTYRVVLGNTVRPAARWNHSTLSRHVSTLTRGSFDSLPNFSPHRL